VPSGVGVKWKECWKDLMAWNCLIPLPVAVWVEFDSDPYAPGGKAAPTVLEMWHNTALDELQLRGETIQ